MNKKLIAPIKQLRISSVSVEDDEVLVKASLQQTQGNCPTCGSISHSSNGSYWRQLKDLPCSGKSVRILIRVRRWLCRNSECRQLTFTQPMPDLFSPHGRRTARLEGLVSYIAGSAGGLPGERILRQIGIGISDDTLLRTIKKKAKVSDEAYSPRVVGIDEWSWRYKADYGTIIVDLERRKVIDVLDNHDTAVVRAWFKQRPEIEVVSRDRCSNFARAAREGAPQAAQVADRFHILHNFKNSLEKQLQLRRYTARYAMQALGPYQTHITDRKLIATGGFSEAAQHEARVKISKLRTRAALFTKAQTMANEGLPIAHIAKELGFKTRTISNWLRNGEMPVRKQLPPTKTSPRYFKSFLKEQWDAGETNGRRLLDAVQKQGYQGSRATLFRFLAAWRRRDYIENTETTSTARSDIGPDDIEPETHEPLKDPTTGRIISPNVAAALCMKPSNKLTPKQRKKVAAMKNSAPEFAIMRALALRLRGLLRGHDISKLGPWLNDTKATGLYRMVAFPHKLARDQDAVENAIRYDWSNGQIEGQVNRLDLMRWTASTIGILCQSVVVIVTL